MVSVYVAISAAVFAALIVLLCFYPKGNNDGRD